MNAIYIYIVLVQCIDPPSFEMLQLINENQFALNVMYVEGSALNNRDLRRCCADTSVAIFVMTNKFADNADEEDAKTILQQFSIRRYCQSNNPFTPPFYCLQLIRPENQRHLEIQGDSVNAFADNDNDSNVIVCLNEIKMGLIGKAVMYPGSAALLMNLLTTIDDDNDDEDEGESFDEEDDVGIWLDEYHRGCDWEIYSTELADMFVGRKFNTLACDLYTSKGILLFALKVVDTSGKFPTRILVNPKNYVIPSKDEYDVVAYVIAKNKNASDLSMKKDDDQDASAALQHLQLSNMMGGRIGPMTGPPDDDDHPLEEDHESVADYVRGRVRSYTADSSNLPGDKEPLEWQKLMRMYDTEKNANESQQEKMQKIEDEYLRANFFMRDSPASLSQVTVHTSVLDEIPNMTNHTIILGKGLSNLFDLIRPLRARSMDNVKCIVILNPLDIPHAVWQRICLFEGIFFVRGSPLEDNDLRRAGIFRAAQVIVLADTQGEKSFGTAAANARGDVAMYDADSIFSFQAVRRLNEKAHCVVEIVKHANIVYLDPESVSSSEGDYRFSPQFAAGTLFTTAMLDTLACQVFYNPQIIKLINKLISSADCKTKDELAMARGTGKEAKGLTAVQSSSLYQIPIPDNLDSRTYGALVRHLTAMGTIPVGLFRGVFQQMKVGPKHNKMPYAYTNPPKDTELFSCDRVFVLSPAPPHTTKLKDVERELQSAEENLIRTSLGARVTVEATAAAMRDQFNIFGANQAIVRRHVDDLGANVKAKLDKVNFAVKKLKEKVKNEETRSVKPVEHKFASRARSATAGAESDSYNASIFRRSGIFGESSRRSSVSSNSGEDLNRRFHRPSDEWEELSIGPPKSDIGTPSVRGKRTSSVDVASYRDRQKSVGFATP